jgi:V8-like Glu-specific endopeptidase
MNRTTYLLFLTLILFISCKKNNVPEGITNGNELYAIGQFEGPMTCTATFVEIPNSSPDAPAIVITNGHCTNNVFQENEIQINLPITASVVFKKIEGISEKQQIRVATKRILYGTMKGQDLAIVELNISNKDLIAKGIEAMKIADVAPALGAKIEAFGYPLSLEPVHLRKSEDVLGPFAFISEFIWLWEKLYSSNFKDIYSGSSGSPVFASGERSIFGLINTTTIGAVGECELGSPCEIAPGKTPIVKENRTYIVDITKLKNCFNNQGVFDINSNTFPYEKPSGFRISLKNGFRNFSTNSIGFNMDIIVENPANTAYKVENFLQFDPKNKAGFISNNKSIISIPIPSQEGYYVVSVLKDNMINQIKYLTFKVDITGPSKDLINIETIKLQNGGFEVRPIFKYPELTQFEWKYGSVNSCDCTDPNGYTYFNRIPILVGPNELPFKFCIIGYDLANNKSGVKEFIIK